MFHYSNFQQILNIAQKKKVVVAIVFPQLQNVKDLVRPHSKKRRFTSSFDSQDVKASKTLVKSEWEHFDHFCSSLWRGYDLKNISLS